MEVTVCPQSFARVVDVQKTIPVRELLVDINWLICRTISIYTYW